MRGVNRRSVDGRDDAAEVRKATASQLEQVPIDWNRRSPMTGLDADDPSFPSESLQRLPKISVRPSKSFRKRSIPFQFLPKISPLNLDLSKAYDRICEFAG